MAPPIEVRVSGPWACFTRPEHKSERVSYPVMTPSAARGILESIFWKPEFEWIIQEIWVLSPIRFFSMVRNELKNPQSERAARRWQGTNDGYFAEDDHTPRHTLMLRDVDYIIRAQVKLRAHANDNEAKYRDQARRRIEKGQVFQMPYLGMREFVAEMRKPRGDERPIPVTQSLGRMFFDHAFVPDPNGPIQFVNPGRRSLVKGKTVPLFFEARLESGILKVPQSLYEELSGIVAGKTR